MKNASEADQLWKAYEVAKATGVLEAISRAENNLAEKYYHLVMEVAKRMSPKLKEVTAEECASYGVDGLYEAIKKFNTDLGIQFRTFAPHRIRGAILDNIRKADWVPRLVRQRSSSIERFRQSYFKKNGVNPSDAEMAEMLECPDNEFDVLSRKSTPVGIVSMYNKSRSEHDEEFEEILTVQSDNDNEPILKILREEMFKKLLGNDFTKLERKIVKLHYYENLTMKEIAKETDFSESRISQMHGDILRRLKQKIDRNPQYALELEKLLESC